jgi:aminoglycoside phosphotransferase
MTAAALLAPDPRLPLRDLLLDPEVAGRRMALRLRSGRALDIRECQLLLAKYRVGDTLRALYRLRVGGAQQVVAARMFTGGASAAVYRKALARAVPSHPFRPVVLDAELDTVLWSFPNDRRLDNLSAFEVVPRDLRGVLGRPWVASELVVYTQEKSATARCLDPSGATIAYAKAYSRPEVLHHYCQVLERVRARTLAAGWLRVPSVLARSDSHRMVWLEAIGGRKLNELTGAELHQALTGLGTALAVLHRLPTSGLPRFTRFDLDCLRRSGQVIAQARPDLAAVAGTLVASLAARRPPVEEPVHLHGDVHPPNVLVESGRLALIDLDQAGAGSPANDLASMLARLRQDRVLGLLEPAEAAEFGSAFLGAYAAMAPLPDAASLRWHTAAALLAERCLRAVNRVLPDILPHLQALLAEATRLLARDGDDPMEVCS